MTKTTETRAEQDEKLRWALGYISRPTLIRGQNDEHCAKYAEAERLLSEASKESNGP